jgi:hypothetical protein
VEVVFMVRASWIKRRKREITDDGQVSREALVAVVELLLLEDQYHQLK